MGYTHYIKAPKGIEPTTFARLSKAAAKVVEFTDAALRSDSDEEGPPELTDELIRFNGVGDDGHETFVLTQDSSDFDFCKTAEKPYDEAVTAVLCLLHLYTDGAVEISSDGEPKDWQDGLALARQVDSAAQVPPGVVSY